MARRTEKVKTYHRRVKKGKKRKIKVRSFKRIPKPKARRGLKKTTIPFNITYTRDNQGRIVGAPVYRRLKCK